MAEIILGIIFLIPTMLGLAEIIHMLKLRLFWTKDAAFSYIIIWLKNETAPTQIMHAVEQYNWQGKKYAQNIIAINSLLDSENMKLCGKIAKEHNIYFCSIEELSAVLNYLSKKGGNS